METNLIDYDTRASWIPPQNQHYEGGIVTPQDSRQELPRPRNGALPQHGVSQKPRTAEKMPKKQALALARTLKRWLVVASIVSFGTFGGLVAFHQVATTASQIASGSSKTNSTSSSSSKNSNNFLKQQGGNTSGTSSSSASKSSTSSSATSSSSSKPVTGTSTS
ncbi:MAG TPA: hypothetical protein VF026_06455 [Ktedonobacteraceae bacterium]